MQSERVPNARHRAPSKARVIALVVSAAAALALAACGSDDKGSTGAAASSTPAAATTTGAAAAADASKLTPATIDLTAKYAGLTPGKADMSLAPLKVAFTNQQGGVPAFPEMEQIADATVRLVNEQLGGVDGHPIKLVKCFILSEEDGQKCAGQMLAAGVKIGNHAEAVIGSAAYFKTIKNAFPTIVSNETAAADTTTKGAYMMDSGGGVGTIGGMAEIANKLGAKHLAFVSSDNPAAKYAYEQLLQPYLKKYGITAKTVFVPDTATTPDYVSALTASGAAKADAVMMLPAASSACVAVFDSLKQLAIDKRVIASNVCLGDPFPEHAGSGLANWYFAGVNTNPHVTGDPQAEAFRNVMTTYGKEKSMYLGAGAKEFQDILLIARFATEVGFDKLTPAAMDAAIRAYDGPGLMVAGTLHCTEAYAPQIGICGSTGAKSTWKDGAFVNFDATS